MFVAAVDVNGKVKLTGNVSTSAHLFEKTGFVIKPVGSVLPVAVIDRDGYLWLQSGAKMYENYLETNPRIPSGVFNVMHGTEVVFSIRKPPGSAVFNVYSKGCVYEGLNYGSVAN